MKSASKVTRRACAFEIGRAYFIRTVTYHLTGLVRGITEDGFLLLSDAAWIADSGRFNEAIRTGKLNEVEPVDEALVNLASVTDAFPWTHPLPREVK
jgi:hypothetical protein